MEEYLLNEAYNFFPKKIFGLDENYMKQNEIERFRNRMKNSLAKDYTKWCELLNNFSKKKNDIKDCTNFLLNQPSFHLKIIIEKNEKFFKTFDLYTSLIIPYYYYSVKTYDNIEKSFGDIIINNPSILDNELIEIVNEISLNFKTNIIDEKYLFLRIPDVSFDIIEEGSFTVMNAFFNTNNDLL